MLHARKDYTARIIDTARKIPENEPVFLIRGQDILGPEILNEWVERYQELEEHDPEVAGSVLAHAELMRDWQGRFGFKAADCPAGELGVDAEVVLLDVESGVPDISSMPDGIQAEVSHEAVDLSVEELAQLAEETVEKTDKILLIARGKELYEETFARASVAVSIQWEALPFAAQRQWVEKARAERISRAVEDLPGSSNGESPGG